MLAGFCDSNEVLLSTRLNDSLMPVSHKKAFKEAKLEQKIYASTRVEAKQLNENSKPSLDKTFEGFDKPITLKETKFGGSGVAADGAQITLATALLSSTANSFVSNELFCFNSVGGINFLLELSLFCVIQASDRHSTLCLIGLHCYHKKLQASKLQA